MESFATSPAELRKIGQEKLRITWKDDHISEYTFRYLRQNCPCAECRDEWTGQRTLQPETIPQDLKCSRVEPVGNYALHFTFSDQHTTGIYSFTLLRKLCPCSDCAT